MDYSFDFCKLLKSHQQEYKKPPQRESVADGVAKRLREHLKTRKHTRQVTFDAHRAIPERLGPAPAPAQPKAECAKQKLQKWKLEKEQKKKEAAARKKKPFWTGTPPVPLKYEPPPPLKVVPSSSGRGTASKPAKRATKPEPITDTTQPSFAPQNATFKPPVMKNKIELRNLTWVQLSRGEDDAGREVEREMDPAERTANKDREHSRMSLAPAPLATGDSESQTFEAGFLCVRSPVQSPAAAHTPAKKTVLSDEAGKTSISKVPNMPTDSGTVNIQKTEGKENSQKNFKIKRQDAISISEEDMPVMTSRRKSMDASEALTPRKPKVLQEREGNAADNVVTPRRPS